MVTLFCINVATTCLFAQADVEGVGGTSGQLSSHQLQCLRWLQVNVVRSPGERLTAKQLRDLGRTVGDDAVSHSPTEPLVASP
jgi:hypothetical protein